MKNEYNRGIHAKFKNKVYKSGYTLLLLSFSYSHLKNEYEKDIKCVLTELKLQN